MITLWPTLTVADVDASLAFYSDTLGFKSDLKLQDDDGKTFLASVQIIFLVCPPLPPTPLPFVGGARWFCGGFFFFQATQKNSFFMERGRKVVGVF